MLDDGFMALRYDCVLTIPVLLALSGCPKTIAPTAIGDSGGATTAPLQDAKSGGPYRRPLEVPQGPATIDELLPTTVSYPLQGTSVGQGYDFVSGRWLASRCINGAEEAINPSEVEASYTDLQDKQQIFDSLKVAASASVTVGAAGGNASVDFAKSVSIERERRNVLATINSMRSGVRIVPPPEKFTLELTAAAAKLAGSEPDGAKDAFRNACGDGYVAAIRKGARYRLVFSYAMDFENMQESLKVAVGGNYGTAKGNASMEQIRTNSNRSTDVRVTVFREGGGAQALPLTTDEALDSIRNAAKYADTDAAPLEVVVIPYRALADKSVLRGRPLPDTGVKALREHYWRILDLSALYASASNYGGGYYYPYVGQKDAGIAAGRLRQAAMCVADMLRVCDNTGVCTFDALEEKVNQHQICQVPSAPGVAPSQAEEAAVRKIVFGAAEVSRKWAAAPNSTAASASTAAWEPAASSPQNSIYDVYFSYLAAAPLKRVTDQSGRRLYSDEALMALEFCSMREGGDVSPACRDNYYRLSASKAANDPVAATGLDPVATAKFVGSVVRPYVVNVKLAAVSSALCSLDITHPMCKTPDALDVYAPAPSPAVLSHCAE